MKYDDQPTIAKVIRLDIGCKGNCFDDSHIILFLKKKSKRFNKNI